MSVILLLALLGASALSAANGQAAPVKGEA